MSWGKKLETLKEIERATGSTPKALRDRPPLKVHHKPFLEAFYELSAGRGLGEIPQPIPLSEIKAYCEFFGINSPAERDLFFKMIRRLDIVFMRETTKPKKLTKPTPEKKAP